MIYLPIAKKTRTAKKAPAKKIKVWKICIKRKRKVKVTHYLFIKQIKLIINQKHKCILLTNLNDKYGCSKPLNNLLKELKWSRFLKVHKSKAVNLHFVDDRVAFSTNYICLIGGIKINVSVRKRLQIQALCNAYDYKSWKELMLHPHTLNSNKKI